MSPLRRAVACALVALAAPALTAAPAAAHATLVGSSPAGHGRVKIGPPKVVLRFDEPVQILNPTDVTVVDGDGVRIDVGTTRTTARDRREVVVPLRGPLLPDSYTVRYRIVAADSHATAAAFVFAVGNAKLAAPILAGAGGLSDESPAAVAARVLEFAALMLLLGLCAFRTLVLDPAVRATGALDDERESALHRAQRAFWKAFWALAILAGVAETLVIAAKSAVVFHTGPIAALLHPADAYRLVAASRFGDLVGWRSGTLFALVAVAFATWNHESAAPLATARRAPHALMALLGVTALTLLAAQGHASEAPLAPLSVAFDAVHLTAVSIWIGGLACLVAVLLRAPRGLVSETLTRFSRLALYSIGAIGVTGIARAAGELSAPAQLFTTGYGRSLVLKSSLLVPILVLGRRNRAAVTALSRGRAPSAIRIHAIARRVQMEVAIATSIVLVAAILVAQVPGRL
jgi:copper transport protein